MTQADKAAEAQRLAAEFDRILSIHREHFAPATRPAAPAPAAVDEASVFARHEKVALQGVSVFKRAARKEAKQHGRSEALREIDARRREADEASASVQVELDAAWERLLANDPDTVLATLEEAFEDNQAPAAAVNVVGDELALVVLVPTIECGEVSDGLCKGS